MVLRVLVLNLILSVIITFTYVGPSTLMRFVLLDRLCRWLFGALVIIAVKEALFIIWLTCYSIKFRALSALVIWKSSFKIFQLSMQSFSKQECSYYFVQQTFAYLQWLHILYDFNINQRNHGWYNQWPVDACIVDADGVSFIVEHMLCTWIHCCIDFFLFLLSYEREMVKLQFLNIQSFLVKQTCKIFSFGKWLHTILDFGDTSTAMISVVIQQF